MKAVCIGVLAVAGFVIVSPAVLKSRKSSDLTSAINNVRQISFVLIEFKNDFGEFPSDKIVREVEGLYHLAKQRRQVYISCYNLLMARKRAQLDLKNEADEVGRVCKLSPDVSS